MLNKNMIKRIALVLMAITIVFVLCSCSSDNNGSAGNNKKSSSNELAQNIYNELKAAENVCLNGIKDMSQTYYYGQNVFSDSKFNSETWAEWLTYMSFSEEDIKPTRDKVESQNGMFWLSHGSKMWQCYYDILMEYIAEKLPAAKEHLETARTGLKELNEKEPDSKLITPLTTYYTKLSSLANFLESPSGTVAELREKASEYETTFTECKNELSIFLD